MDKWTVTASASKEGQGPERAVDGNTKTWWQSGAEGLQWIQVDWRRPAMVCGFSLQWGRPHATAYAVETSIDGKAWTLGYETDDGDGDWDQALIEPIMARHVRVRVVKGLQGPRVALASLEINGVQDQPQVRVDGLPDPGSAALLDGNLETKWRPPRATATVSIDLRREKPIGGVRIDWGPAGFASNVVVEYSTNGTNWTSAGRIQSQTGNFDVLMGDMAFPARFVRLSFSGALSQEGFEVADVTFRGAEGTARPWAMIELAAAQAPEGVYPDVFRNRQNYWVAASGLQRDDAESQLDEWGMFSPKTGAATLSPLIATGGEILSAHQATELIHRLGGDGAPMPETTWKLASGLSLRIRALARSGAPVATTWVQYELANESIMAQTGRLCWVVRPVRLSPGRIQGGLAPIHKIRRVEAEGWQELWVNNEPLFAVPDLGLSFGVTAFDKGDVAETFRRGETPKAQSATDENGLASGAWWMDFELEPGEKTNLVVAANASPAPVLGRFSWTAGETIEDKWVEKFDREWVDSSWAWRGETSRYFPKIDRPDAMECLRAQTGWLLGTHGSDGEEMEEMVWRVAALLRAGQAEAARRWIDQAAAGIQANGWVPHRFLPSGLPSPLAVPEGHHASQGQFIFMLLDYYRFTKDMKFLHGVYPQIKSALAYLQSLHEQPGKYEGGVSAEERYLVDGLLPPSIVQDARPGGFKPVYLYADHYWALLGWKEGRAAASLLGLDEDADWADSNYRALKSSVRRSLRSRMDLMDAMWIPASAEESRFDARSVALMYWPCEETDLAEPHEFQSSMDAFYGEFLARGQPGWSDQVPSDEGMLLVPLASMGRGNYVREVLYSLLDRRYPKGWNAWARTVGSDPRQKTSIGDMPDIRSAAAYLIGVRGLAARETGKRLDLFSGAPAEWLQHGDGFRVYGMPTAFGPLDLGGVWKKKQFTVEIGGGVHPPSGYRLWWPRQLLPERVLANGKRLEQIDAQGVDLPHDFKGRVEVFFPHSAPWPRDP